MTTWRGHLITQPFGVKSTLYRLGFHAGIDLYFELDEEQPAYAPGIARYYPDKGDGYGNVGTVTLSNGDVIFYAHLKPNGILVTTGTQVKEMQPVFVTGKSGYITGLHAHIEYRIGGNKNNPVDITKKLKGDPMAIARGRAIRLLRLARRSTSEAKIQALMQKDEDTWLDEVYNAPWFKEQSTKLASPTTVNKETVLDYLTKNLK